MAEIKIIDRSFAVSRKRGNGTVRYEVWQTNVVVTRYNLAYINHLIYSGENIPLPLRIREICSP